MTHLAIQPITQENFAPFGDVIACHGTPQLINNHRTERFHNLARIDLLPPNPHTLINIFKGQPISKNPHPLELLERHPLGSQAFIPINEKPYLVLVAPPLNPQEPDIQNIHAFFVDGHTGINYRAGVWHHPLLPLLPNSLFTVIDRGGDGHNLDLFPLHDKSIIINPQPFLP